MEEMPMDSPINTTRQTVLAFWQRMQRNDWQAAAELFDEAYTLDWPQSGERIRGRAAFVAINSQYPAAGRWQFTLQQLVVEDEIAVSDVLVSDGVRHDRAITFSTVRAGRIVKQVEYWPERFVAPAWRAAWVESVVTEEQHDVSEH
jgi:ketosteroid isomerase-like protein